MADMCGAPLLQRIIERLRLCCNLDAIVIATTVNREDDPVDELGRALGVSVFRGDET